MSVTVELYEYEESMDDDLLHSMGVKGGLLGQLTQDEDIDDEMGLLMNATSHTVGSNKYDFPRRILEEMQGITEVDSIFLTTIQAAADELAEKEEGNYSAEETLDWLREHEGEKIFVKGL